MKSFCFRRILLLLILAAASVSATTREKLPVDSVGRIDTPTGRIAFVRNGDIWVMKADGTEQKRICQVSNAEGRLSWSPDNKRIVFTRSGSVDLQEPDMAGTRHKVYDLFICYLDSADAGNTKYWTRLTDSLGARGPEWSGDSNTILFWRDMNANRVNARSANYQLCVVNLVTGIATPLRQNWQPDEELFLITPSMNSRGEIAFVFFDESSPGGLVVMPTDQIGVELDSIKVIAEENQGLVAPSWSPDDRWLAVVGNYPDDSGLYVATPDLQQKYIVVLPTARTSISKYPPSFSPDSRWLTFATSDGAIWICDITGNGLKRLTRPGNDEAPCWSR